MYTIQDSIREIKEFNERNIYRCVCRIKESAMDVEVFQGLEIVGSLNHSQAWRGKWRNGIITTEWCLELRLTQVRWIMRQNNLATSRNTEWTQKKQKKAGKEIFLLYFCFSFFFYSSAWISHWQNPIESQRVRAWVMLSKWHPYQGRIGHRMNWGSEKQPPRWLPTITASWYSFPCVSSPWIKAGHCHTLLMNRMWQVLKSHFHDMIPSWLPSWASILDVFPCPLTSSFYGKPVALLRGKKNKNSLQPSKELRPSVQQP